MVSRREFAELASLAVVGAALPGLPARRPQSVALEETTIAQLQDGMKAGRLTARGVAQAYLDRIAALDRQGPTLRAVLETNPEALAIADAMDGERRRGKVRGPLHGIPVIVKDNIDTHDRMQTTAGSLALEGNIAVRDAAIVEEVPPLSVKGKSDPLTVWRLRDVATAAPGWDRRLDSPLVGRVEELSSLQDVYRRTLKDRTCQLLTIAGTAGVGKSRVTTEFLSSLGSDLPPPSSGDIAEP